MGNEKSPIIVYNAKDRDLLQKGMLTASLSEVATIVEDMWGFGSWTFKDATPLDVINRISFADSMAQPITIRIGFMWSAKPSYDEEVKSDGVDVNQQLLPMQALVDYWNSNQMHYPKGVKLELVYAGHGMDLRNAVVEAGRLVMEEKVAFVIGDMNTELTTVEGDVIRNFGKLQCSSLADSGVLIGDYSNGTERFITGQGSLLERGDGAGIILDKFRISQVAILYEESIECQSMVNAFLRSPVTISWKYGMPPINLTDNTYRNLVQCGSYGHYYSLLNEAVKQ
ncbi:hypothetical protein HK102_012198, partial [Quaeritorhiza haematococci]